ncbi:MAG TPA: MarR family transcriptional regulator [Magnetospirillaceae bacterium]|jgi:DNA-binding MarR family transcriptional regulator
MKRNDLHSGSASIAKVRAKAKTAGKSAVRLEKADYERLAEFRYVLRQFTIFSETAADQAGLEAQQHQALLAIKGFAGRDYVTTGELAERLGIRPHSAVGLVDRLVLKELVTRETNEKDRRQVLIALTAKAEKLLLGLSVAHRDELERLAPVLRGLLSHFESES